MNNKSHALDAMLTPLEARLAASLESWIKQLPDEAAAEDVAFVAFTAGSRLMLAWADEVASTLPVEERVAFCLTFSKAMRETLKLSGTELVKGLNKQDADEEC